MDQLAQLGLGLTEPANELFLSAATIWEIAIQVDDVLLISGDATFDQYGISRLW